MPEEAKHYDSNNQASHCCYISRYGTRRGQRCTNPRTASSEFCEDHIDGCSFVPKTGKHAGQRCRENVERDGLCHQHKHKKQDDNAKVTNPFSGKKISAQGKTYKHIQDGSYLRKQLSKKFTVV